MNADTLVIAPLEAGPAKVDPKPSSIPLECQVARAGWTRDVEALCRAIEKQQREHPPKVDAEQK